MPPVTDPALVAQLNAQARGSPAHTGGMTYIPGPPRQAPLHTEQTPAETAIDEGRAAEAPYGARSARAGAEKAELDAETARLALERRRREQGTPQDAQAEVLRVIRNALEARRLSRDGNFTTGIDRGVGVIAEIVPGTDAANLASVLDNIQSNVAFTRLQQMRQESPTGGAVGNVSDRDLQLLSSTIASLSRAQSDQQFQKGMRDVIDAYARVYRRLGGDAHGLAQLLASDPEFADGPVPTAAMLEVLGAAPGSQPSGGPPRAPQGTHVEFTDEQQRPEGFTTEQSQAWDAFTAANPRATPQQLQDFARSLGVAGIENAEAVVQARDAGAGYAPGEAARFQPPDISDVRGAGANPLELNIDSQLNSLGPLGPLFRAGEGIFGQQGGDAFRRGFVDVPMLGFSDEIQGSITGDIPRERAINAYDEQNNSGARLSGQVLGGFTLPGGAGASLGRNALVGAGYGAAYGLGTGEGGIAERGPNALVGAGVGAAFPLAMRSVGIGRTPSIARNELVDAAERQSVPLMRADTGGPMTRRLTAGAAQMPFASGPIVRAANATNTAAGAARDRAIANIGGVVDPEAAGEAARRGARSFIGSTSGRGSQLYTRAERAAGDARITPIQAWDALDRNIAELADTPGGAEGLSALRTLREELNGTFTVAGMRRMRSALRDRFIQGGLRGSDLERRVNQVVDAAGEDVATGLRAQGRAEAARLYGTADRYWRNRLRTIDSVLEPIIGDGNRSGEEVIGALQRSARGNTRRLEQFIRALPDDEAATVRATLISQIGRSNAGTEAGNSFSLNQFLTHYNQMTPRARRVLFGSSADALDDIARIARGTRQAQGYANRSNTGGAGNVTELGRLLSFGGGFSTLGTTVAGEMITGRLLASQPFSRWLARAVRSKNPRLFIQGLSTVATRDPAITQDALGLQRLLLEAVNENAPQAGRLAASPGQGPDNADQ